jgi:hypothetical protein
MQVRPLLTADSAVFALTHAMRKFKDHIHATSEVLPNQALEMASGESTAEVPSVLPVACLPLVLEGHLLNTGPVISLPTPVDTLG